MSKRKKHADWWGAYDPQTGVVIALFDTEEERDEWLRSR